jgi:energy-coupling factor transporter ATP-binding protein EcfA2
VAHSSYRLSGAIVVSEIPLPVAPVTDDALPPDTIVFRLAPALREAPVLETADAAPPDVISLGKDQHGLVLRFPGQAEFWIAHHGAEVVGVPLDGAATETVAQLFVDRALPLALHARGRFTFHASAVAIGGRDLVAFLGPSGAGKSTLASSLVHAASGSGGGGSPGEEAGPPATDVLFCDDCLAVERAAEGVVAHPSYSSTRLWDASAGALFSDRGPLPLASPRTGKRRAWLPAATEPMPIRRLYLLESTDGDPTISRLRPGPALARLVGHLSRVEADRARLVTEFDFLERVVSTVPVAVLAYRRAFDELPAVRRAVLSNLKPSG